MDINVQLLQGRSPAHLLPPPVILQDLPGLGQDPLPLRGQGDPRVRPEKEGYPQLLLQ